MSIEGCRLQCLLEKERIVVQEILKAAELERALRIKSRQIGQLNAAHIRAKLECMTTLLEGGRIGKLIIVLDASLGEVRKSSNREKARNRGARCFWIVLRKLKVAANVREAELIEQPGAEHVGLTDRKVVVVDYLVAGEQPAELSIADLGDVSWPVSNVAKG